MGVQGLLKALKVVARQEVDLRCGDGMIICDGHFLMHKMSYRGWAATALVLDDNELPLAEECAAEISMFLRQGWTVIVVFDGATPPAKLGTSQSRSEAREEGEARCREKYEEGATKAQVNELAKKAVSFSPSVTARVSKRLRAALSVDCYTSPFEADPQIKLMEEFYTEMGYTCYVYATDADLVVLGVRNLLFEVFSESDGGLRGLYISRASVVEPKQSVLSKAGPHHDFLRLLHGIDTSDPTSVAALPLDEAKVAGRLVWYACVAGNDYARFAGVGPVKAADITLRCQSTTTTSPDSIIVRELAEAVAASTSSEGPSASVVDDVVVSITKASDMFRHGVAFDPETGRDRHLSGQASSIVLSLTTGSLSTADVALKIVTGEICPKNRRPWDPPILEGLDDQGGLRLQQESGGVLHKRPRTDLSQLACNNHRRSDLPGPDADFSLLSVVGLRSFIGRFRCIESSGISAYNKAQLVTLAEQLVNVVALSGVANTSLTVRDPRTASSTPQETLRRRMPQIPDPLLWVNDWQDLRDDLAEMHEVTIVAWFRKHFPMVGATSRVLYRGMQRVMDLGAVHSLRGVPCGYGDILWLSMRTTQSMRPSVYDVYAMVRVEKLYDGSATNAATEDDGEEDEDDLEQPRLVATEIIDAFCTCQSGLAGGCNHVCQLLQVVRLLQMTARELRGWDPTTVTGKACEWLLKHSKAGRDPKDNVFWLKDLGGLVALLRSIQDPKKQVFGSDDDEPASKGGVVVGDRSRDFDPHAAGGAWADRKAQFDQGVMSRGKLASFMSNSIEAERRGEERGVDYLMPICPP